MTDFLTNRTQCVWYCGVLSKPSNVTSGVPHGSVLGSTLFLIYINDVLDNIANELVSIKLFADDIKFYSCSSSATYDLQGAINNLTFWSWMWQLSLALRNTTCHLAKTTILARFSTFLKMRSMFGTTISQLSWFDVLFANLLGIFLAFSAILGSSFFYTVIYL